MAREWLLAQAEGWLAKGGAAMKDDASIGKVELSSASVVWIVEQEQCFLPKMARGCLMLFVELGSKLSGVAGSNTFPFPTFCFSLLSLFIFLMFLFTCCLIGSNFGHRF